jgi:hypothetical protein
MFKNLQVFLLFSLLFNCVVMPVNAKDKRATVSLEQASEMAREKSKGKVLSARTTNFNGEKAHRIQVLTPSGRVKIYQIPVDPNRNANFNTHSSNKQNSSHYNKSNRTTTRSSSRYSNPSYQNNTRSNGDKKQK